MSARGRAVAAVVLAWVAARAGHALEDPTRPPMGQRQLAAKRPATDLVLQSVIISDSGRAALINGELVQLGGRLGEARLVRVGEAEVELLVGEERRTLALFPGVAKSDAGIPDPRRGEDGPVDAGRIDDRFERRGDERGQSNDGGVR